MKNQGKSILKQFDFKKPHNLMTQFLKENKKVLIISFINAIALFFLSYFIDNLPYSFVGGANTSQRIEQIKHLFRKSEGSNPEELLFINVAYDRELVSVEDEFGLPMGNIDITDRTKLLNLFKQLKQGDYKEIILDVSFTDKYSTEIDSSLFALIASMNDIVIAKSETTQISDTVLSTKARYSDYSTHISESNFVKYEYLRNGENTLPYQVYLDIYGDEISSFCGMHFFRGRLANRSVVMRHPVKLWNRYSEKDSSEDMSDLSYYNLGSDLLDLDVDISTLSRDKIVIIGDLTENDLHDTYLGKIAGPVINVNAYYALVNEDIIIPYWEIIFVLFLYSIITFFIIKTGGDFIPILPIKSKLIQLFISLVSVSTILTAFSALLYIVFGLDMNILVPSIWFSGLIICVKYNNLK